MVKPSQVVAVDFTTRNPSTGAAKNASVLPTGVLVVDGVDNGATVTVGAISTGIYSASVTIPALVAGQVVQIRIAATVTNDDAVDIADNAVIWQDVVDTKRVADLNDPASTAIADAVLIRGVSNVEDTADATSLAALILATFESIIIGTTWTISKTGGGLFVTKTVTLDPMADPITGVT